MKQTNIEEICYRCKEKPFLKKYYEIIDGVEHMVCGKCRDIICSICGKSRYKDDIKRWTHAINKETGEILNFGGCCVTVVGKQDAIKVGTQKYNEMKKKHPEVIAKMDREMQKKENYRKQMLGNEKVAENLIDNWAKQKQQKTIKI